MSQPVGGPRPEKHPAVRSFWLLVIASAILPFVPVLRYALIPFDFLNTHIHELFHALAAVISGGSVESIVVFPNTEGVTRTMGGIPILISMAGYLGAALLGGLMIKTSTSVQTSKVWAQSLGIVMLVAMLLWVRGTLIGFGFGLFWVVTLLAVSAQVKTESLIWIVQFIGIQQGLNALKSLRDLILLSGQGGQTDAHLMQQFTGIPAVVWAVIWTGIGAWGIFMAITNLNRLSENTPRRSR